MRIIPQRSANAVAPSFRQQQQRWDEGGRLSMALGCLPCIDLGPCGGLRKRHDSFSCLDDCCGNPSKCDNVCPRNLLGFKERIREINGFHLDNIPRVTPQPTFGLPSYVPYIYHGNRRAKPLDSPAVALPLRLFYRKNGQLSFSNRTEVEVKFGIGPRTLIILIGSGRDKPIEKWWGLSEKRASLIEAFRAIGVALVTGPNYSVFTDEVRYNDMYNMKRIGIAWQEIVAGGVPAAYHLNARTPHDYRRLRRFIEAREEVAEVAFEFKTGTMWQQRRRFHVEQLVEMANSIDRPLHLIMIGGIASIRLLTAAYPRLTYIDTSAFMSTLHRQRLYLTHDGKVKKVPQPMPATQLVDDLLIDNIKTMQDAVERLINGAQVGQTLVAHNEQKRENPEIAPSGRDLRS